MRGEDRRKMNIEAIAGGMSGVATRFLIAPFDVLKIRFQNQVVFGSRYSSIYGAVKDIYKIEGIHGFWRGTVPGILLWGTYSSIQFPVYYQLKRVLHRTFPSSSTSLKNGVRNKKDKLAEALFCGGLTACMAQTLSFPLDNLRTRIATYPSSSSNYSLSILSLSKQILKKEGFRGFFAGLNSTLLQVAPNNALVFGIYEFLEPASFSETEKNKVFSYLSRGAVSGLLAKIVTYPLDTVKKRLQLNGTVEGIKKYRSTLDCVKCIRKEEGLTAFYKGLTPQLYKTAFSYGLSFTVFEVINKKLKK